MTEATTAPAGPTGSPLLLQDKVVVLSGVGPGLGRALGDEAARMGADLVLASRTQKRLDAMAPFQTLSRVGGLKPGAVVLAQVALPQGDPDPR